MKGIGKGLAVFFVLIGLLLVWGVGIEPRYILDQNTEQVTIPGLPEEWEDQEVAFIADVQIGMWLANEGMARRAIKEIVERRPAAVLLGGDFLYHPTDDDKKAAEKAAASVEAKEEVEKQIQKIISILQPALEADLPTYAVLGNHDYLLGNESVNLPKFSGHIGK